jgi:hypothetical protein
MRVAASGLLARGGGESAAGALSRAEITTAPAALWLDMRPIDYKPGGSSI